jgi:hypothetical protein
MTQGNALFSAVLGNALINFTTYNISDLPINDISGLSINVEYTNITSSSSNCSCQQDASCAFPARIFTDRRPGPIPIVRFTVPGVVFACYIADSILQSNLGCFYNQSCTDDLIAIMASPVVLNTTALDTRARNGPQKQWPARPELAQLLFRPARPDSTLVQPGPARPDKFSRPARPGPSPKIISFKKNFFQ